MTAFVILAAGRGTRSRPGTHKALLPVGDRAVLSHLFDLSPPGARLVVVVGNRADQIRTYCALAHPDLKVTFVEVQDYDAPGSGPGTSLLAAQDAVGIDDLVFTTCDTLWDEDLWLWARTDSWAGISPIPEGTKPERWCRILPGGAVVDKQPGGGGWAWTGMARICRSDLGAFWAGIRGADTVEGERQISGGLAAVGVHPVRIGWTDVGDTRSYVQAVGYDSTKPREMTYLFPDRVVKMWERKEIAEERALRAEVLTGIVPKVRHLSGAIAHDFVEGMTAYEAIETGLVTIDELLVWAESIWIPGEMDLREACLEFYRDKTYDRIDMLPLPLREECLDALHGIDWEELAEGYVCTRIHGDLNLSNIIVGGDRTFTGIDWRQNFAGNLVWGDRRYDQAKLLTSCQVDWREVRKGRDALWAEGPEVAATFEFDPSVHLIAALSLLNSAPLHAAPLDRDLVEDGLCWLGTL